MGKNRKGVVADVRYSWNENKVGLFALCCLGCSQLMYESSFGVRSENLTG